MAMIFDPDDPATISNVFQMLLNEAKNDLIGSKGLKFAHIFAFQPAGGMTIFAIDPAMFNPNGKKQQFALDLRAKLRNEGFSHYGFVTEVWISNDPSYGLPEHDPNRDEALQLIVGTRARGYSRSYRMVKRPDGTIRRLSERDYDPDATGGRFGALLSDTAWTPDTVERRSPPDAATPADPGAHLRH